jgi:hypothetical protein
MKRKLSAFNKVIDSLNRLLPFVGFLLVIAGIVGLVFVQKPLDQTQELRSDAKEISSTNNCGESCTSNADCAINLRCYSNECRLVTNPSSTTCSATTQKTISPIYQKNQENKNEDAPLKKGDNVIPSSESNYNANNNVEPTNIVNALIDEDIPVDETVFDLLSKMLKDKQQNLPTTVILIGVGLLLASLIILLASKLFGKKTKPVVESNPIVTPESSQDTKVKDLLKKLEKQSKDHNQG